MHLNLEIILQMHLSFNQFFQPHPPPFTSRKKLPRRKMSLSYIWFSIICISTTSAPMAIYPYEGLFTPPPSPIPQQNEVVIISQKRRIFPFVISFLRRDLCTSGIWTSGLVGVPAIHRLRHIDTHLALYTMLYNNSAKNRYAEPVHNKTLKSSKSRINMHNLNLMQ